MPDGTSRDCECLERKELGLQPSGKVLDQNLKLHVILSRIQSGVYSTKRQKKAFNVSKWRLCPCFVFDLLVSTRKLFRFPFLVKHPSLNDAVSHTLVFSDAVTKKISSVFLSDRHGCKSFTGVLNVYNNSFLTFWILLSILSCQEVLLFLLLVLTLEGISFTLHLPPSGLLPLLPSLCAFLSVSVSKDKRWSGLASGFSSEPSQPAGDGLEKEGGGGSKQKR